VESSSVDSLDTQALDSLPVAVCVTGPEGRIIRFNQRAVSLWGRPPTAADIARGPAAQVLRTGRAVADVPIECAHDDGRVINALASATPLHDARGRTVAVVTTFIQNTAASDADVHRARLAAIVVTSEDAIISKTLDGIIESWNASAERIFGFTAEEAIGQHIMLIVPPDRVDEEEAALACLRRGEKIDHFETVRVRKDGRLVDVSLTISPIKGSDGRIIGASKVARDITERRLAHEALARSQQRYQRIFDGAGVSIWEEDFTAVRAALDELRASGVGDVAAYFAEHPHEVERYMSLVRVVDINETTVRMFGATDKRTLLDSLTTVFTPEARDIFAHELVALAGGYPIFEGESVLRTLHGDRLDVLVSITLPTSSEPADSVLVTLTDITLQKAAERARRDSEALFHEMADSAPAMLWTSDASGAWTFLSRQWYELTGQAPESAMGRGWLNALHPDDRDSAAQAVRDATDHHRAFHFECRLSQRDAEPRWTIIAGQPRVGAHGEFLGFVGSAIDISERRKAEEAVIDEVHTRETLSRVGAALASELDPDTLIQSAIDAATALTSAQWGLFFITVADDSGTTHEHRAVSGLPVDAFADASAVDDVHDRPAIVRIDDLLHIDDLHDTSGIDRRRLPQNVPVRSYLSVPVVSRTGDIRGGVCFGHTRPRVFQPRHEQLASGIAAWAALALDNASLFKEAQEASRAKDEFIATLSHELRTPLNAMLGWAHMLRANVLPPETQRRALETLERNVRTQAQLVDDLLDVSRIVAGKLHMKGDEVDLTTVMISAADTVRPSTVAKGLSFDVVADPDRQVIVMGDADRLRQIFWNLLTNAVKFTPRGGRVEIELRTTETGASVVVTDTGQGIRPEFLRHVFERFRQADSTASRRHGGLGLGLAIVRHLVEAHGGSVVAESPGEGLGATFTVHLPVRDVRRRSNTGESPRPRGTALAGLRVLLVDDDSDTREVLRVLLEVQGATVTPASSAGEALDLLRRHPMDVLLADIGMPEQDGYALIEAIRALPSSEAIIPAVAVTAYVSSRDRARAFKAGYGWHVAKPVDPDQLVAVVTAAARSHPSQPS
jgi:PAS domain S-box-containing protein